MYTQDETTGPQVNVIAEVLSDMRFAGHPPELCFGSRA